MEKTLRSETQTTEDSYVPKIQQPRELDNISHGSQAADGEIQSNKDSESDSNLKEECHQVKKQGIHSSVEKHAEKKPDKSNKDINLIKGTKAESNHQTEWNPENPSSWKRFIPA